MSEVEATAENATSTNSGIYATEIAGSSMYDVKATSDSIAMYLDRPGSGLAMDRVTAKGTTGIQIRTPSGTIGTSHRVFLRNVWVVGSHTGLAIKQYEQTLEAFIEQSFVYGGTDGISVLNGAAWVGGSRLTGGVTTSGTGTATCACVWGSTFTFYPDTCP